MKLPTTIVLSLSLLTAALPLVNGAELSPKDLAPDSQTITIVRSGSQAPQKGPADRFTGSVRIEPLFSVAGNF